ncbi:MAG: hypothetical protein R2712_17840 [Vicinamibacterales bacterium]
MAFSSTTRVSSIDAMLVARLVASVGSAGVLVGVVICQPPSCLTRCVDSPPVVRVMSLISPDSTANTFSFDEVPAAGRFESTK